MDVDEFGRIPAAARRTPSPPPPREERERRRRRDTHHHHHHHHHHNEHRSSSSRSRKSHPSERYVEEPMLCEYVWKDQQQKQSSKDEKNEEEKQDKDDEEEEETYDEYRRHYCLNYVRSFFNKHLDDSWFRGRYSPLERQKRVQQERQRAQTEAQDFSNQLLESLKQQQQQDDTTSTAPAFVVNARLGGGQKQSRSEVPSSHVLSIHALQLSEVPPHVTDDQLKLALMDHCSEPSSTDIQIYSSTPTSGGRYPLQRDAFGVVADEDVLKDIYRNVQKTMAHVPRKHDRHEVVELDVECSDPYGRLEYDHDGKGSAPPDGLAVPHRKSVVLVSMTSSSQQQQSKLQVLSAALSCQGRILRDKEAASTIARALDVAQHISSGCRLDDLLEKLSVSDEADLLDISIAYLRRVHLFSFYNGCTRSSSMGDVLAGKHAASTIHLRLQNADEILEQAKQDESAAVVAQEEKTEDAEKEEPVKDLLVQRLDDSIAKALEECSTWIHAEDDMERDAEAIQAAEKACRDRWLQQHSILDDDGRARCSFHFCRKLFKDSTFLRKHLMKKHVEYLRAEQAKCHDEYMMKAWDGEEQRPVPDIMVDCGANFGLMPASVTGKDPIAVDPEPELWRKEEERRKRAAEMQQRREELRQQRAQERALPMDANAAEGVAQTSSRSRGFVDVDDMKEEKVEISFENVEVPVKKKKKKKRKLL